MHKVYQQNGKTMYYYSLIKLFQKIRRQFFAVTCKTIAALTKVHNKKTLSFRLYQKREDLNVNTT